MQVSFSFTKTMLGLTLFLITLHSVVAQGQSNTAEKAEQAKKETEMNVAIGMAGLSLIGFVLAVWKKCCNKH